VSKYIRTIPLAQVDKLAIVFGRGRSPSKVRGDTGCDYVINGGYYNARGPVSHLKAAGKVYAKESWNDNGYAWTSGKDIQWCIIPGEAHHADSYITAYPLLTSRGDISRKLSYSAEIGGVRGRTAMALAGNKLILYVSRDGTGDAKSPEGLRTELFGLGADTILMLDSGGSSQCDFGGGQVINTGRKVNNYICVWLKKEGKEDKPMGKYIVHTSVGLKIRSAASSDSADLGLYPYGTVVEVLERKSGWGRTEKGWVSMTWMDPAPSTPGELLGQKVANTITDWVGGVKGGTEHKEILAVYNGWTPLPRNVRLTQEHAYCAATVSAAYIKVGIAEYTGVECSCNELISIAKSKGIWVEDDAYVPKVGDAVLYDWDDKSSGGDCTGAADHIGIVIRSAGGTFIVAEGNMGTAGKIGTRTMPVNGQYIRGFIAPDFGAIAAILTAPSDPETEVPDSDPTVPDWAAEAWAWCAREGIMDGKRPMDTITRAEVAVIIKRLYDLDMFA